MTHVARPAVETPAISSVRRILGVLIREDVAREAVESRLVCIGAVDERENTLVELGARRSA